MSGNQHANEPRDGQDRQPSGRDRSDPSDREPDDDLAIGHAHPPSDDDDDDDDAEDGDYVGVAHKTSRAPQLEDEAEADVMDVDDLDDLESMDGPDA